MAFGWHGKKVRLVPLDEERHLANAYQWINDPEVTSWILGGDFPMAMLAEREWFNNAQSDDRGDVKFAIETLEGIHIGFSGVHGIDWRNGVGTTGTIIGRVDLWGQGFGTDASQVRARYAFDVLGLRMLLSGYLDGNEGSRLMNERTGYVECGRIPSQIWKRGRYRDHVQTVLTRDRWEGLVCHGVP